MRDALDGVFVALLDEAYDFGAGLLKWGGDALLLFFDGPGHEQRACRACWEMQRTLDRVGRIRAGGATITLRMSVGVATGTFQLFMVGGVHRELLVAGPATTETVTMEALADAGEILVSPTLAQRLEPSLVGMRKEAGLLLAAPPEVERRRAAPVGDVSRIDIPSCIPIAARAHVMLERSEPEHRTVTAAFIDLMDTDTLLERLGPQRLAEALDERVRSIQEVALHYEVPFYESDVGKSSVKVLLTAGAPSSTGHDEESMLRALRDVIDRPGLVPMRVGVNTGRVFTGDFGPPYRRSYRVFGDAVNTAARVMSKAGPGEILATEVVLDRSRTTFETTSLEPFAAKGKAEPIRARVVGAVTGTREARRAGEVLAGRDTELSAVLHAVDEARRGTGWVIEIAGGAGLGKSRLVEEAIARSPDVLVLHTRCEEYETSTPYFPLRSPVRAVLGLGPEAGIAETERRLREAVANAHPDLLPWLPLLGILLGLDLPDTSETRALDERFLRERLAEVAMQFLYTRLAGTPTMLVVEDAQFMDEASRDLLHRFARAGSGLRQIMLVTHTGDGTVWAPVGDDDVRVLALCLLPLPLPAMVAIAERATADDPLPAHEIEEIARRAGGNALFLFELLETVSAAGSVDALPDTVEALIAREIDRLSPADRTVLRYAAVLGATFEPDLLAAAVREEMTLDDGVWSRLGGLVDPTHGGRLRFRNTLVRDTAYEGLPYRRRRQLHRRVATALEALAGEEATELAGRLTRHFAEAGNWAKTVGYGWRAGKQARDVYANVDAASLLELALAATRRSRTTRPEVAAKIAETLAEVRYALGDFDAAAAALRLARRRVTSDPVERARLTRREAGAGVHFGRFEFARRLLGQALATLEGVSSVRALAERAEIGSWRAMVSLRQGRPGEAVEWARRAIADAEDADAQTALGRGLMVLDLAHVAQGRLELATHGIRALGVFERLGELNQAAMVWNNLGLVAYYRGAWDDAIACYARAKETWERTGDRASIVFADYNMGEILAGQGRLAEAEPLLRSALRAARGAHNDADAADAMLELGKLEARRENLDAALELLRASRDAYAAVGDTGATVEVDARIAEALLLAGDAQGALEAAQRALEPARAEAGTMTLPVVLRVLGRAHSLVGRRDDARRLVAEALAAAEKAGHAFETALALDCIDSLGEEGGSNATVRRRRDELVAQLGIIELPCPSGRGAPPEGDPSGGAVPLDQ
jgi:class 3 adenylate cyclase/tetratricopeptide (TPR) repeat protein